MRESYGAKILSQVLTGIFIIQSFAGFITSMLILGYRSSSISVGLIKTFSLFALFGSPIVVYLLWTNHDNSISWMYIWCSMSSYFALMYYGQWSNNMGLQIAGTYLAAMFTFIIPVVASVLAICIHRVAKIRKYGFQHVSTYREFQRL
jgi:hypothetical protein